MAIRDTIVSAVQSSLRNETITTKGGGASIMESGSGADALLEDLRKISGKTRQYERLTNVLKQCLL